MHQVLIDGVTNVDASKLFAHDKLSKTLFMYRAKDFNDGYANQRNWLSCAWIISHVFSLYHSEPLTEACKFFNTFMHEDNVHLDQEIRIIRYLKSAQLKLKYRKQISF